MEYVSILLLLLVFVDVQAIPSAVSASSVTGTYEHHLAQENNDTDVSVTTSSSTFDLVCPSTHPVWFLPHNGTGAALLNGNRLRITLSPEERPHQRGLYTCCPNERIHQTGERINRLETPPCCPCCTWPKQEACSNTAWNASESITVPHCLQVFLFTGAVSLKPVTLQLPWRSQVLIPCPLSVPEQSIRIYSQIPNIPPSREPWYDRKITRLGQYNPRIGLCTKQERVPDALRELSCEYGPGKRIITPQKPHAPPTILPNVSCSISPMEHVLDMGDLHNPLFRVQAPANVSIHCTALYDNPFIAKRRPWLCFRWRGSHAFQPDEATRWSHFECVQSNWIWNTVAVSASRAFNLTLGERNTTIGVEVVEQNRATASQSFSLTFLALGNTSSSADVIQVEVVEPQSPSSYRLFSSNFLAILEQDINHLTIGFFTLNEIAPNTSCFSPTHDDTFTQLIRTTDMWLCRIQIPRNRQKFNVILNSSGLSKNITIFPSLQGLLPRTSVSGLRGSVTAYINVTCLTFQQNIPDLMNFQIDRILWTVYRGSTVLRQVNSSSANPELQIAPLVKASSVVLEPLLDWNSSDGSNPAELMSRLSSLTLPPAVEFSRRLCATCEAFFGIGSFKSPRECVTLELGDEEEVPEPGANGARRSSFSFIPTQISNSSSPSFRVIKAYPAKPFNPSDGFASLSVFSHSLLELRCSVSRRHSSTAWPLIFQSGTRQNLSTYGLPPGNLLFYALPFALESRLLISSTDWNSTHGVYLCGDDTDSLVPLSIEVLPAASPEVIEPNQPVRYFIAHEIIRLTCQAVGNPTPSVTWYIHGHVNASNATSTNTTTHLLKTCNSSIQTESQSCSLVYMPYTEAENVTIECEAINYMGRHNHVLQMIRVNSNSHLSTNIFFKKMWKNYVFWIIAPLVVFIVLIIGFCSLFWRKSRQVKKADKLIKMNNLIYGRTNGLSGEGRSSSALYHELLCSLMPTEELRERWCIARHDLRPFSQPLGSGHYGMVQKGVYYAPVPRKTKNADTFFVALKSPSPDLSSLTCFRNEIAHLMRLSGGPNIVRMIGCAFGEKEDLRDSLLVLEFCPNTSLSDFVRRMLYPRNLFDHKPMYKQNTIGEISTGDCQTSTTPLPTSGNAASHFAWDGPLTHITGASVRILHSDYDDGCEGSSSSRGTQKKRRRRDRRNTALVYQRLTRNSSSIFLQIAKGIARGLEFLAENNVIHRDLATRNILMDSRYEPKICDFGLAVTIDLAQDSPNGMSNDTSACYQIITFTKELPFRILPPEALSKQLFYLTSDIWEFGLLLWQMFFFETRKPFENVPTSDALLRLLSGDRVMPNGYTNSALPGACRKDAPTSIDRPPAVPNEVWRVICDCLRVEANERPCAKEVRQQLEDCYAAFEENADGCTLTTTVSSTHGTEYQLPCFRDSSTENIYTLSPAPVDGESGNYENIFGAAESTGYLESFPFSSL